MHPVILDDPENNVFALEEKVCQMCAGQQIHGRALAEHDEEWAKRNEGAKPEQPRPGDGRHTYLRPIGPEEIERVRSSRAERPTP